MTMRIRSAAHWSAAACVGLALAGASGCAKDEHRGMERKPAGGTRTDVTPAKLPPPAVQNEQNAQELLRQADEAEARGDYARALEVLERLRPFPENARPKDLEQRITHVREKVKTPGQGN